MEPLKARTCFCSLLSPPHELHAQQLINEGDRASSMLSQRPANRDYDRSSATSIPIPAPPCSGPLRSRPRSSGRLLPNNSGPRWFRLEEWMAWITFIGMEHFPSQIGALESEARAWAKLTGVKQLWLGGRYRGMRGQLYTPPTCPAFWRLWSGSRNCPQGTLASRGLFPTVIAPHPHPRLSPSQTHLYPRPDWLVQLLTGTPSPSSPHPRSAWSPSLDQIPAVRSAEARRGCGWSAIRL